MSQRVDESGGLEVGERSREVFELLPGYPKAPPVPLPAPGDLDSLVAVGLRDGGVSRFIARAAMAVTGFNRFLRQDPEALEGPLRRHNARLPGLFAPIIAASAALEDDPRGLDGLDRATTLVLGARSLYEDLFAGRLEVERHQGQALEMGQYPNFFGTSLIPEPPRGRLFKSADASRINVVVGGRLFSLALWEGGRARSPGEVRTALEGLVEAARARPLGDGEVPPGLWTNASGPTQMRVYQAMRESAGDTASLALLRRGLFTLCLDLDARPTSNAELLLQGHRGDLGNRWAHSSLQIVVCGNGRAALILHFTAYIDGNTMMQGAAGIRRRAAATPLGPAQEASTSAPAPGVTAISFERGGAFAESVRSELRAIRDEQQATFEIPGLGRTALGGGQGAVPAFVVALAMTARRYVGRVPRIEQFMSMSRYRGVDVLARAVSTPEVQRFVEAQAAGGEAPGQSAALLREAMESQVREGRKARARMSLPLAFQLFLGQARGVQRWYMQAVGALAFGVLRLFGLYAPQPPEIVLSHPELVPDVPLLGRPGIRLSYVGCFGLHYQILEDRILVTVMPSLSWKVSNADFIAELRGNLERVAALLAEAAPGEKAGAA